MLTSDFCQRFQLARGSQQLLTNRNPQWTFQALLNIGRTLQVKGGGGGGEGTPMATVLGKVETKVLPSFDSQAILLAVFTQKLKILLAALNIMILILFLTRI